jgi:hypothetical protein
MHAACLGDGDYKVGLSAKHRRNLDHVDDFCHVIYLMCAAGVECSGTARGRADKARPASTRVHPSLLASPFLLSQQLKSAAPRSGRRRCRRSASLL